MAAAPGTVTAHKGVAWKTILIIILLIAALSVLAALPLSFFMNGNMGNWFGNVPLDLIPIPDEPPPPPPIDEWEIPDLGELPSGWEDWELPPGFELPAGFDGTLPEGEIPWWLAAGALAGLLPNGSLPGGGGCDCGGGGGGSGGGVGGLPGMGGSMGNGLGPFGSGSTVVLVSTPQPWRYWRIGAYDYFEGATWLIADNATAPYSTDSTPGTDYTVIIQVIFTQAGYGTLPLPSLWNKPMLRSGLQILPSTNVTWTLIEDQYGQVHLNASIPTPGVYAIMYDVTYDNSISLAAIESNVYAQSPLNFVADPGDGHDYLQIPDLSAHPQVVADMQALASNPAIASNNTYETALAVMEYFKTQWSWTPFRMLTPGAEFDPSWLINNGYGVSSDFASNYVMYLRSLNISSRLVWGGVGYQDVSPVPGFRKLTHSHFWAEVWIPNATNTGGNWVQIDPNPLPPIMWQPDQSTDPPGPLIPIDVRRSDTRVETSHYTMLLSASVLPDALQNPGDLFDLDGVLTRDGTVLTTTWLNEPVSYTYMDVTEKTILGTRSGSYTNHNFTLNSLVGPHRFNASFHAVVNETIVTCNGTTAVGIRSLAPTSIVRGTGDFFIVDANISDSTGNPVPNAELQGHIIDINQNLTDNYGVQLTDINGNVTSSYSFPSSQPEGIYNFTMRFNGTFTVDYPAPYPDYFVTVPAAATQSPNETITVTATLYINLTSQTNSILPRGHTIELSGYLTYDNLTGINNGLVTVWWANSTGTYNLSADATNAAGFYQVFHYIPQDYNDGAGSNDVRIWANFSIPWGNATTDPSATYHVRCQNQTNITLNTDLPSFSYILRGQDSIHVWGTLWDPLGYASTAGQVVWIAVYETMQPIGMLTTDASGNFDGYVQIPITHDIGVYNLSAGFLGDWSFSGDIESVPSSMSVSDRNPTHEAIIVASTVLTKTSNPLDAGRVVTPVPIIAGDPVYVSGFLLFENGSGFGSQVVSGWWIEQDGTENYMNSTITQASGFYNITYQTTLTQPSNVNIRVNFSAGSLLSSYILNATTDADPPVVWAVNVSIDTITPNEVLRGQTSLTISGRVWEKHNNPVPGETIRFTFDGTNVRDHTGTEVTATTNGAGFFSTTFIPSGSLPIKADYNVSATLTNSSFILNALRTEMVEVNSTTNIINMAVDRTAFLNENITISGNLVDSLNQATTGNVSLFVDGNLTYSEIVTGSFSWTLPIPNDPGLLGVSTLQLWHPGSGLTYPSYSTPIDWNIPEGAAVAITNIAGFTSFGDLTLNGGNTITVSGTLGDNASSYGIVNRLVEIYYNNTLIGSGATDSNGEYHIQITLPAVAGNTSIYANFTANSETFISQNISVEVIIPPGFSDLFMQILPWLIGAVVGIVAVYVTRSLYLRRGEKEKKQRLAKYGGLDIDAVNAKLAALTHGKRFREAIIYAYYIYMKFMQDYFGRPKRSSQTVREYAMDMVKKVKIPPTMIYPFTSLFEDASYGKKPITETQLNEALQLFLTLHERIVDTPREIGIEDDTQEGEA